MHLMNLQGYIDPRTKGYKTNVTNSGCKLGEGFKLSQQCSSRRAFKRKSASNTTTLGLRNASPPVHMGHVEVLTTDCSGQGFNCT